MARELDADYITEIESDRLRPCFLFQAEFQSSILRLWSGYGDLSWDGETYFGNGWFTGFSGIGESRDIKATNLTISLTGVPSSIVSLVLAEALQNKLGYLWLAFLDEAGDLIEDPYLLFEGKLDTADLDDGPDTSNVTLTYETELIDLEKAQESRFTDAWQKAFDPADRGLEYVLTMANWDGFWGVPEAKEKKKDRDKKKKKNRRRKNRK